jgi:diguanylate cyclase (GGDEF)-like protein
MFNKLIQSFRHSIQLKLFLSLTVIVALSLAAILASQVYLVQEYFVRQAETNLRGSNYLLSRVLADPLFERDFALLQTRLGEIQSKLPLCNFQLKDHVGSIVYKVGEVRSVSDASFDSNTRDHCFNTVLPVIHGDELMGTVRMGVRTDDIAQARSNLINESIFFAMFWFAIFMLPFFVQIRRLTKPLVNLSKAAQEIAKGNLDYPAPMLLRSEDELSQLISSFKGMTQSLVRNRDEQAASLDAIKNEKTTLDTLLTTMPLGVVFADHSQVCYCNDAFRQMFQLGLDEQIVGMKNDRLLLRITQSIADTESALKAISSIIASRKLTDPAYITLKNGRILRLLSNVVIAPESSNYLGRFWLFEDETKEQRFLQEAELNAEHDALTSIYNRRRFDMDLPRMVAQAERDKTSLALMIFDLDEFKPINDIYGHESGDIVLKQISKSLSLQLRRNEVLYRIGGDEFALLLGNISDDEVKIIADRIVKLVCSLKFEFKGNVVNVGCSIGIASFPVDSDTPQSMLHLADQAMYEAKKNGKCQFVIGKRSDLT